MNARLAIALASLSLARAAAAQEQASTPAPPGAGPIPVRAVRHVPVDVSLFPPISTNGETPALNHLSLGLAGARSAELRGFAFAPVHWADGDVTGVQATWVAASAGGTVRGAQLSQIAAIARHLRGVQMGGAVALARGDAAGVQMSWGAAIAPNRLRGVQLAVVNVGGDVAGAQIGLVNLARRVSGLQLGLVNLSRSAGAAVGLVSLVGDGRHELEAYATELSPINLAARLGGRRIHGVIAAGIDPDEVDATGRTRWTAGAGAGGRIELGARTTLDVELVAQLLLYDREEPKSGIGTLRLLAGFRAARHLAVFAGPSLDVLLSDVERSDVRLGRALALRDHSRLWAGFAAGVRI